MACGSCDWLLEYVKHQATAYELKRADVLSGVIRHWIARAVTTETSTHFWLLQVDHYPEIRLSVLLLDIENSSAFWYRERCFVGLKRILVDRVFQTTPPSAAALAADCVACWASAW